MNIDDFRKNVFEFQYNLGNTILDIANADRNLICDEEGMLRFTITLDVSRDEHPTVTMDCEAKGFCLYSGTARPELSLVDDV